MRPCSLPRVAAIFVFLLVLAAALPDASAQGILIPVETRRDFLFDHSGRYLYITTSDGWVRPYNLFTGELETGYYLGGSLNGADISSDDSFLLVAQNPGVYSKNTESTVHKLDLRTGGVTNISYPSDPGTGVWDVAIASNGVALVTATESDGFAPLRQIDLATNAITERSDAPPTLFRPGLIEASARLSRSADRKRLSVSEIGTFKGHVFTYSAETNTFGSRGDLGSNRTALNRDGTLIATGFRNSVSLDGATDYNLVHAFSHLGGGVAFDAITDTLYAASVLTNEIIAYDTNTFIEKFRLGVGESLGRPAPAGVLVASNDGRYLALETKSGIRVFEVPTAEQPPTPPTFGIPMDMVFDQGGNYLYITTLRDWVWPYNLRTGSLETPYYLGGSLSGLDIAPDDSFLLVAQFYRGINEGTCQKVDLRNREVTNINYPTDRILEMGSWDVAIGANGLALTTSHLGEGAASGWAALRQIDLASNTISVRTDATTSDGHNHMVTQETGIHRSADRSRFLLLEANISTGPMFTYDAVTNSFGPLLNTNYLYLDNASAAVNRNGTLLGIRLGDASLRTAPDFNLVHNFNGFHSGVAFDAVRDIFYAVNAATSEIVAYDTNTFSEAFRLNIGESLPPSTIQFDVGNLVASQDGKYLALITPTTLRVFDVAARTVTALPTPMPTPAAPGRLVNISTRTTVWTGDNVAIAGFILSGNTSKKVALRAMGPSLSASGVPDALQDTVLELHDQTGAIIASNDNWKETQQSEIVTTGLAPKDDREAAIVIRLQPGQYTVVMKGKNQGTGVALVELYDVDPTVTTSLANISTRALVSTGDMVMIGGLIIQGGSDKVLVRGIGPSLTQSNIPNALENPSLELYDGNGVIIAANDNWKDSFPIEIRNTGLAPKDDQEAAILTTLPQGHYTAVLRGQNETSGVGLVEAYDLP